MNYDEEENIDERVNAALMHLVQTGQIEMGVNEKGEFVFWMTEEQKASYEKEMENGNEYP